MFVLKIYQEVSIIAFIFKKRLYKIIIHLVAELSTTKTSEITEMLATLINFLSEITLNTPSIATVLLEDFKSSLGYHFLVDFTLKLESRLKEDYQCMLRVISLVAQFTKVGCSDLKPRPLSVNQLFIMDDFSMPRFVEHFQLLYI